MSMKAMFGALITLILAVGGVAMLSSSSSRPVKEVAAVDPTKPVDLHESNPFEESFSREAKATVDAPHFEFEPMALGDSMSHDFVFTNKGTAPLRLAKGPLQCKCTMPTVGDGPIPPGESVKITLTWKPVEATKDFHKTAVIWTNDAEHPRIDISIHGVVIADPAVFPNAFSVGNVRSHQESQSQCVLVSTLAKDLKVESVETTDPELQVEIVPWTDKDFTAWVNPEMEKPTVGYFVNLKMLPVNKSGPFSGMVTLKTNHKSAEFKIPVNGVRVGPISVHHPQFNSVRGELNMGRIKATEGKALTLKCFLQPFGQELQLSAVEGEPKRLKLSATLKKDAAFQSENRELYELTIQVPPGVPKGGYADSTLLRLKTNHPDAPELILKLAMVVY